MSKFQELQSQIAELQKQAEQVRSVEVNDAAAKVKEIIRTYGLTPAQCGFGGKVTATQSKVSSVEPKYRDPKTGKTWSGRGKPPSWITGKPREQFLINPPAGASSEPAAAAAPAEAPKAPAKAQPAQATAKKAAASNGAKKPAKKASAPPAKKGSSSKSEARQSA